MQTKDFLEKLEKLGDKEMRIEYRPGEFLPTAFHITEVKNVFIESVDCGGNPDSYRQTVIQLWWDGKEQKDRAMSAAKALKILEITNKSIPMRPSADLFLEWGHGDLLPAKYKIKEVAETEDTVTFRLFAPPTVCKPIEKLGAFGNLAMNVCGPGSKCC